MKLYRMIIHKKYERNKLYYEKENKNNDIILSREKKIIFQKVRQRIGLELIVFEKIENYISGE